MNKIEWDVVTSEIVLIIILGSFSIWVITHEKNVVEPCLVSIAQDYCLSENTTFARLCPIRFLSGNCFYCYNPKYYERTRNDTKYLLFYFTEEEIENCRRIK